MQREARFASCLWPSALARSLSARSLKGLSRETMVKPVWLSFLLAAVMVSACGQDAPEPARSTATPLPTAMPVPTATTHIPVWLPTAVANTPGSTPTPDLSTLSLPTADYASKDSARGVCDLQHLYDSYGLPRRLHGLRFSLNLDEREYSVEMRLSVQNYTDEVIKYVTIDSATIFAIVNTRSCEIFWREPYPESTDGHRWTA